MPTEVLTALDHISEVTINIAKLYEELTYLRVNETYLPNYQERLESVTNKISALKKQEDEYYKIFDDIAYAIVTMHYLSKLNISKNETESLCANRIINRITRINTEFFIDNPEAIPEGSIDPELIDLLLKQGYSEQESISILLRITMAVEYSIMVAQNNIQIQNLPTIKHETIRTYYVKRLNEQALVAGNKFEAELIKAKYQNINNHLNEDIKDILPNDFNTKRALIDKIVSDKLALVVSVILTSDEPEILDESYILFNALILHLSTEELNKIKQIISFLSLVYQGDTDGLLKQIDKVIELRNKSKEK